MNDLVDKAAAFLGIDRATLERVAHDLGKAHPELREQFDQQVADKGLNQVISELENELEEVLNHVKSPGIGRDRGRG